MKLNYQHLVQKPYLCGPACIQMILLRRGIWIEQEEIAKEVGVKIPKKDRDVFYIPLPIGKTQKEYGISLTDFNGKKIRDFLKARNIQLQIRAYLLNEITDVPQFIKNNLNKGNDIIANFWMKHFNNSLDWGHFSLISEISGKIVTLCDPWPQNKSFWKTDINELEKTMSKSFDGSERGFITFIEK